MSALVVKPTVSGARPGNDTVLRATSSRWCDVVCPPEHRRIMFTREVKTKPGVWDDLGSDIFAAWQKALLEAEDSCTEIVSVDRSEDEYPQVFDLWMFETWKVLSLWDLFSKGPASQMLHTSPIVEKGVVTNQDFWNLHDFLPDHFNPPPGGTMGKNTPENEAKYMVHCRPTDEQILQKIRHSKEDCIRAVKAAGGKATINVLCILTNDNSNWLEEKFGFSIPSFSSMNPDFNLPPALEDLLKGLNINVHSAISAGDAVDNRHLNEADGLAEAIKLFKKGEFGNAIPQRLVCDASARASMVWLAYASARLGINLFSTAEENTHATAAQETVNAEVQHDSLKAPGSAQLKPDTVGDDELGPLRRSIARMEDGMIDLKTHLEVLERRSSDSTQGSSCSLTQAVDNLSKQVDALSACVNRPLGSGTR
ncbi:hypothetical protein CPC08DRAFT_722079 [Agrocybe pediades]|nr:hypothetical protein CPC08DRAFT_722079 [Agrocybe pediades]